MSEGAPPADLRVHGDLVLPGGSVLRGGHLGVRDGTIITIAAEPFPAERVVDARGRLVLPGVVDAHVHTRSNPEEGIGATTHAAAAGGTTTVIDMPFDAPDRPVRSVEVLEAKIADVNREAYVDVALWATFAPEGELDALEDLAEAGAAGFKASVYGVDPRRFPRIPDDQLLRAFERIAALDRPVAAHQENQEIVDGTVARAIRDGRTEPIEHARTRPAVAETEAAGRLLELAHWTGARLHMVHGTVPRTFDQIAWHRTTGTRASGETCAHYLVLDETALERMGARAKCNPPLRRAGDVAALWDRLAAGGVDLVTSDHSPYPEARKSGPVFDAAAGLPGVETLLHVLYGEGVARGRIGLPELVRLLAEGPADVFGLHRKGRLAVGHDADLVLFDPETRWTLTGGGLHHPTGWTPFEGLETTGRVEATYVRGRPAFDGGHVRASTGDGRFVAPGGP